MPEHSTYVQGGARFTGKQTKTGLKDAIKYRPHEVTLYGTSDMGPQFSNRADALPEGTCFNVVGPNPYSRRDWYASVYRGRGGKLVVR